MSTTRTSAIGVRVQPRASRNEVLGVRYGVVQVRVKAAPVDGKANAAMLELLADKLGIAKSRMRVVRGHTARDKVVTVEGLASGTVMAKLGE